MKADILFCGMEQVRHHLLGQPDRLVLQPDFQFNSAILGLVEEKLTLCRQVIILCCLRIDQIMDLS